MLNIVIFNCIDIDESSLSTRAWKWN